MNDNLNDGLTDVKKLHEDNAKLLRELLYYQSSLRRIRLYLMSAKQRLEKEFPVSENEYANILIDISAAILTTHLNSEEDGE